MDEGTVNTGHPNGIRRCSDDDRGMFRSVRRWIHDAMASVFPSSCLCCGGRLLGGEQYVCASCLGSWPYPTLITDPKDNLFVRRFWGTVSAVNGVTVFNYFPQGEMKNVIHDMKYRHQADLCRFMGRVMGSKELVRSMLCEADCLIPVPITEQRRQERGYNQSELLCEGISSITGTPVVTEALLRTKFQDSQTTLNEAMRRENVVDAFALGDTTKIEGKHVVIVDDIVTTGSTLLECMFVMKDVPGIKISVLSLGWTAGHWR